MTGIMAVPLSNMAGNAEIIIFAVMACNKLCFVEH